MKNRYAFRRRPSRTHALEKALVQLDALIAETGEFTSHLVTVRSALCEATAECEALRAQADNDYLTGLANSGKMTAELEAAARRTRRLNLPLGVVMADVDDFKTINDTFGHRAGDRVLRTVARLLRAGVRDDLDLVARSGGEEFVLVLPGLDEAQAEDVAERIRARIAAHVFRQLRRPVTISVGVASTLRHGHDVQDLLDKADHAMYAAKRAGKNQVAVALEPAAS